VPARTGVGRGIEGEQTGLGRDFTFGDGGLHWRLPVKEKTTG
jgi:hypothetical protein